MYHLNQKGESTLAYILYLLKQTVVPSIKQLKAFKLPGLLLPREVCIPTHHISFTIHIDCSASQQNVSHSI